MKISSILPTFNKTEHANITSVTPRLYWPIIEKLNKAGFKFFEPKQVLKKWKNPAISSFGVGYFISKGKNKELRVTLPLKNRGEYFDQWGTQGYITVDNWNNDEYSLDNRGNDDNYWLLNQTIDRYIKAGE